MDLHFIKGNLGSEKCLHTFQCATVWVVDRHNKKTETRVKFSPKSSTNILLSFINILSIYYQHIIKILSTYYQHFSHILTFIIQVASTQFHGNLCGDFPGFAGHFCGQRQQTCFILAVGGRSTMGQRLGWNQHTEKGLILPSSCRISNIKESNRVSETVETPLDI